LLHAMCCCCTQCVVVARNVSLLHAMCCCCTQCVVARNVGHAVPLGAIAQRGARGTHEFRAGTRQSITPAPSRAHHCCLTTASGKVGTKVQAGGAGGLPAGYLKVRDRTCRCTVRHAATTSRMPV